MHILMLGYLSIVHNAQEMLRKWDKQDYIEKAIEKINWKRYHALSLSIGIKLSEAKSKETYKRWAREARRRAAPAHSTGESRQPKLSESDQIILSTDKILRGLQGRTDANVN